MCYDPRSGMTEFSCLLTRENTLFTNLIHCNIPDLVDSDNPFCFLWHYLCFATTHRPARRSGTQGLPWWLWTFWWLWRPGHPGRRGARGCAGHQGSERVPARRVAHCQTLSVLFHPCMPSRLDWNLHRLQLLADSRRRQRCWTGPRKTRLLLEKIQCGTICPVYEQQWGEAWNTTLVCSGGKTWRLHFFLWTCSLGGIYLNRFKYLGACRSIFCLNISIRSELLSK